MHVNKRCVVVEQLVWSLNYCRGYWTVVWSLDCKTVGFFLQIRKEIGKAWRKSLACAKRASLRSLPSLALCFQPRSRPFVWLLARTWIRKNTDCFAVYVVTEMIVFSELCLQNTQKKTKTKKRPLFSKSLCAQPRFLDACNTFRKMLIHTPRGLAFVLSRSTGVE